MSKKESKKPKELEQMGKNLSATALRSVVEWYEEKYTEHCMEITRLEGEVKAVRDNNCQLLDDKHRLMENKSGAASCLRKLEDKAMDLHDKLQLLSTSLKGRDKGLSEVFYVLACNAISLVGRARYIRDGITGVNDMNCEAKVAGDVAKSESE